MYDLTLSFDELVLVRFLCESRIGNLKVKAIDFPNLAKDLEEEAELYKKIIKRVNKTMEGDEDYVYRRQNHTKPRI